LQKGGGFSFVYQTRNMLRQRVTKTGNILANYSRLCYHELVYLIVHLGGRSLFILKAALFARNGTKGAFFIFRSEKTCIFSVRKGKYRERKTPTAKTADTEGVEPEKGDENEDMVSFTCP